MLIIFSILAIATDYLDGYFARKLNQVSELGKILDPLADKIIITAVVIAMISVGKLSIYLAGGIILRDLLILIGGLYTKKMLGYVIPSNQIGKWTVTLLTYYLIFRLLDGLSSPVLETINFVSIIMITAMLIISFIAYVLNAVKLIRNKQNETKSV
jgi:CDP-diacylglycerol--glycerol-3-phosphate 3-phosphatidyltransferase